MADETSIEWCDKTFNPWLGCTPVSAACDHCYAEAWAKRSGHPELWRGERRRTSASYWQQPFKWNREAAAAGHRPRIFPSLCDPFDNQVPARWRDDFWHQIDQTPHLDWLLLTKRPQNIPKMLPDPRTGVKAWGDGWPNVWLGTTCETQDVWDRNVEALARVPAAVRWVSAEPLLGPVDLTDKVYDYGNGMFGDALKWHHLPYQEPRTYPKIDWIVIGGESGPGARPFHIEWARSIIDQCKAAGVAVFCKQLGAVPIIEDVPPFDGSLGGEYAFGFPDGTHFGNRTKRLELNGRQVLLRDRKGGNPEEWAPDLRVREYPAQERS